MLVITRKIGERVYIGDDIYITLLEINGNKVRLGIVAPTNVTILREELLTNRNKDTDHAPTTNPPTTTTPIIPPAQNKHRHSRRI